MVTSVGGNTEIVVIQNPVAISKLLTELVGLYGLKDNS